MRAEVEGSRHNLRVLTPRSSWSAAACLPRRVPQARSVCLGLGFLGPPRISSSPAPFLLSLPHTCHPDRRPASFAGRSGGIAAKSPRLAYIAVRRPVYPELRRAAAFTPAPPANALSVPRPTPRTISASRISSSSLCPAFTPTGSGRLFAPRCEGCVILSLSLSLPFNFQLLTLQPLPSPPPDL